MKKFLSIIGLAVILIGESVYATNTCSHEKTYIARELKHKEICIICQTKKENLYDNEEQDFRCNICGINLTKETIAQLKILEQEKVSQIRLFFYKFKFREHENEEFLKMSFHYFLERRQ